MNFHKCPICIRKEDLLSICSPLARCKYIYPIYYHMPTISLLTFIHVTLLQFEHSMTNLPIFMSDSAFSVVFALARWLICRKFYLLFASNFVICLYELFLFFSLTFNASDNKPSAPISFFAHLCKNICSLTCELSIFTFINMLDICISTYQCFTMHNIVSLCGSLYYAISLFLFLCLSFSLI